MNKNKRPGCGTRLVLGVEIRGARCDLGRNDGLRARAHAFFRIGLFVLSAAALAVQGCGDPGVSSGGDEVSTEWSSELTIGSAMDCPNGATGACTVRNMPLLLQTDPRVDVDVANMGPAGCYDASVTIVDSTAIANRLSTQALHNRTLTWNNISAGNNGGSPPLATSKQYEQLSQEYRWAKQFQGGTPNVQPFHFPELVSDFSGTALRYPAACDPKIYGSCHWYTKVQANDFVGVGFRDFVSTASHMSVDYIKTIMNEGFIAMVAFQRFVPRKTWDAGLGGWTISFTLDSQHKVPISGYQPGTYPLRINDVGSGARANVTLTEDVSIVPTYDGVNWFDVKRFDFPGGVSKTLFRYEPVGASDGKVFFVQHIDALSLGLPSAGPVRQVWSGTWSTGFTTLMPFVAADGQPAQLAYNTNTGTVHFDKFFANAQGANTVWSFTWGTGFSHFVPFYVNGKPHFIAYSTTSGDIHYDEFPDNLQGPIIHKIKNLAAGFTSATTFKMGAENYLLFYSKNSGAVRFEHLTADGHDSTTIFTSFWGTGWTDFHPYEIGHYPYMVAYNSGAGTVHYDRLPENLNGSATLTEGTLGTGLTLAALAFPGPGHFVSLSSSGSFKVERLELDGTNAGVTWTATLLSGATSIVPFRKDGKSYVLLYNNTNGAARSYELTLF